MMMTLNLHQISLATKVHTAQYNDRAQLQIPTGFEKPAKSFILPHPILLWNTDEYYIKMILAQASTQSCFSSQYLFSKFNQNSCPRSLLTLHRYKVSCYHSWKTCTIQNAPYNASNKCTTVECSHVFRY